MTQPQRTRLGSSYLWIIPLVVGFIGILSYMEFDIVRETWSAIASSALGTTLFAIALTVGICGSIAIAVIWRACQREHRDLMIHGTAMSRYLSIHDGRTKETELHEAA